MRKLRLREGQHLGPGHIVKKQSQDAKSRLLQAAPEVLGPQAGCWGNRLKALWHHGPGAQVRYEKKKKDSEHETANPESLW